MSSSPTSPMSPTSPTSPSKNSSPVKKSAHLHIWDQSTARAHFQNPLLLESEDQAVHSALSIRLMAGISGTYPSSLDKVGDDQKISPHLRRFLSNGNSVGCPRLRLRSTADDGENLSEFSKTAHRPSRGRPLLLARKRGQALCRYWPGWKARLAR
jgi:hypothetical protein